MKDQFEQISDQIHELRNFLSPLDLRLENLGHQVEKSRLAFELKASQLESKLAEHSLEIERHSDQIRQIQLFLKMPANNVPHPAVPAHEDKLNSPEFSLRPPPTKL